MIRTKSDRDELLKQHYGLAVSLARRFALRASWGESVDDLTQVALLGLVRAAERFDPSLEIPFAAFAAATITGELKHHLRDRSWTVRPPRRVQDLYLRMQEAINDLNQELGRAPTFAEIGRRVDVPVSEIVEAYEAGAMRRLTSLDSPSSDEDSRPLGRRIPADSKDIDRIDERLAVTDLLEQLPERQRRMVRLRYMDGLTQHEIAERMSMSQAHVQRLLVRSLDQLRVLALAS
jgi:RNA polymerase sigma-B factor